MENSLGPTQERRLEALEFSTQVPETNVEAQDQDHFMSNEDSENDDLLDDQD